MTTLPVATDRADRTVPAQRRELGVFLRSRRERIRPDEVGFAPGGRRRTPGLRREEVALLAGVGVTWYTWLEQGRDINVSAQVLDAIATALRFDRQERNHLYRLAGVRVGPAQGACSALPPTVQKTLDAVSPYPALALNDRYDILAFNDAYCRVVIDLEKVPVEDRNMLWLNFVSNAWKCSFVDAESTKHHMVAAFRAASADHVGDALWQDLIQSLLSTSPYFGELWERYDVDAPSTRTKVLDVDGHGILRIEPINLWLSQLGPLRVTVYTALDEETETKLRQIVKPG
ncbi:helix-turn-helix transcriptional regulator [Kribbella jiaozuonensis]|uniref:Helix-turn-helix domain-containing protein n=1 Tax=Kribbella jiaozuonensis TaxID=2575441 RepID=A0A4U3M525_9ACTN|nr:helix-turn-helix transcriptional regulator [Kribbella jiaozuonensis]TKK82447.1 helix-turn-helix domain-containing protein [Kribbella jiaozuonensis]